MRKYLINISFWIFLFFGIGFGLLQIPAIRYYGNTELDSKIHYFKTYSTKYNTIMVGTSRVYRQCNPKVIDSIGSGRYRTFNFGLPASNFFEQIKIVNTVSKENLKYVIWEVLPINEFNEVNINSDRSLYIRNVKNTELLIDRNNELGEKYSLIPYIYYIKNVLNFKKIRFKHYYKNYKNNGFETLDGNRETEDLIERRRAYLSDTMIIQRRIEKERKITLSTQNTFNNQILELHNHLRKDGIELILLVPPLNKNNVDLSTFVKNHIKIIDLYSPEKYPAFYLSKNIFDKGHLNKKGADIFSITLAEQLNQITKP